jgi:thiamine biosynthesis lipoprotein ApbE
MNASPGASLAEVSPELLAVLESASRLQQLAVALIEAEE